MSNIFVRDKSFYKKLLVLCLPMAAQQLITAGVNMMDTLMLGRVGETALSAASIAGQVHLMFLYVSLGVGNGSSTMFARYIGAKDDVSFKKTASIAFRLILALALIYTLFVGFFPETVMRLLTDKPDIIEGGVQYLKWTVPCYFMVGLSTVGTGILRNIGKVRFPLYTSIISFFLNIFCNWVFIFGKFGAPAMGVAGAALGTTVSRIVETTVMMVYIFGFEKGLAYRVKDLFISCRNLLGEYFKITVPTIISDVIVGVGLTFSTAITGRISEEYIAGNSITSVVQQLVIVFSSAVAQPAQIIIGNSLGEGQEERSKKEANTLIAISWALGVIVALIILALTPLIIGGYKLSEGTQSVATQMMYGQSIYTLYMIASAVITKGILRGGGDTRFLMIAEVIFLWCVSLPLGYLFGLVLNLPPIVVFLTLRIDYLLKTILCMFRFRSGKWIKRIKSCEE